MANQKITELTAITTCNLADLLAIVDNVAGTPVTRKITIDDLFTQEGIITITPGAGSDLAIELSTTGDLVVNTTQFVVDTSTGFVGIGIAAPEALLNIYRGVDHYIQIGGTGINTGELLKIYRSRGADFNDAPLVNFIDNHVSNDQTVLRIQQTGTGDILNLFDGATEVFTVLDGGNVGIGIAAPTAKTHIDQASTTEAIPVLLLDQADLSEEFIDLVCATTGAGDPVDTATAVGAAYARMRVAVNGTFKYIQLYDA